MTTWNRTLDAAGVHDAVLRSDYAAQRRVVARYRPEAYLAVRLLVPAALVPHVVAATAFMHRNDDVLDSEDGTADRDVRRAEYGRFAASVRDALAGGTPAGPEAPLLRALAHSASARPELREAVEELLETALADLDFVGFTTEADYQSYLDAYALPALMVVACLLGPVGAQPDERFRAACRTFIDGGQRLDFVNDLAEDLAAGRLTVPTETLDAFGVTRADLVGEESSGTAALIRHLLDQARTTLVQGRALVALVPPENRPMTRALIGLEELTAAAAARKGPALLQGSARPSVPSALALLLREYREARRVRRGRSGTR
ncbi:phytoene/squalene synthase family protein [Streptacidiphilus sp. MAP5-3]|uniref:phytoene/squalene synthase family protein n=1 Tax=unclassified Streptacidiphilus TaxID=2643834 RepID=UPI0035112E81